MAGRADDDAPASVLFEFVQVGQLMRVAAIDEATGTEVIAMAPLSATRQQMQAVALAKLRRRLAGSVSQVAPAPSKGKLA